MTIGGNKTCIGIQPIGEIQPTVPKALAAAFLGELGLQTRIMPPLAHPFYAYDKRRIQYNAAAIISNIEALNFVDCGRIIALLDVDLFIPVFTYVFGEARQGGNHALVSTYRLNNRIERVIKVALHEFGHLCCLGHCPDAKCLMNFSKDVDALDTTALYFCGYCAEKIKYECHA